MKLVEILARGMDEWPEGTVSITQDGDDGLIGKYRIENPTICASSVWSCYGYKGMLYIAESGMAEDWSTAVVTREMWEAERAKLNHAAEWYGDGLPPSGTDIEYLSYLGKWKKGRYLGEFGGRSVCGDYETGAVGYVEGIRPMRTAELIAAEERERVLDDIYRIIRNAGRPGNKADMAEALYDAGYRKQEKDQ